MTDYFTLNIIRDGEYEDETPTYTLDADTDLGKALLAFIDTNKLGTIIGGIYLTDEYIGRRIRIKHQEFGCETRTTERYNDGGPWREGVLTALRDEDETRYFTIDGVEYNMRTYTESEIIILP
jgi:hypothetical protein